MSTKNVFYELRAKSGLTQDELAEKVYVTRQAVSRWENGETVPNTETLKLLSSLYNVSINTLLGSPRKLICQCCGMPLEDNLISHEKDGSFNEDYCRWCYTEGTFTYHNMDELIDVCVKNMANEYFSEEEARKYLKETLPTLNYWKKYEELSDDGEFEMFRQQLISEINDLHIEGMPEIDTLYALAGSDINLAYTLPSGHEVKFLDDSKTYLGTQVDSVFGGSRHFGIAAGLGFILISTYEDNGKDPELVIFKNR